MKQVLLRDGRAVVEDVPAPAAEPGRVLVRTAYSVVSPGTEREILAQTAASPLLADAARPERLRRAFEILKEEGPSGIVDRLRARREGQEAAPGYAASGRVESVGKGVADLPPGTRVACAGAGYASHAEILAVPRNLVVPVPAGVPLEEAAFATLGAIALQGVRRGRVEIGDTAAVLGLGLLGNLVAQIARAAGAAVLGFDADRERARRAAGSGCEAYDLASRDPRDEVARATAGLLADVVFVCAASPESEVTNLALRLARKKGRVVLIGATGLSIDRALLYEKELDLLMSTSYGPGRYDSAYEEKGIDYPAPYVRWTENRNLAAFLSLLASGRIDVRALIDRVLPVEEAGSAYELIASGSGPRPLGVVLQYDGAPRGEVAELSPPSRTLGIPADAAVAFDPVPSDRAAIGVGLCGAGAFVKAAHLPALRSLPGFALRAVVSATPTSARETARRHAIPFAATDLRQLLLEPSVDLVLVGTRHHLHAAQAREALRAGRHVLVEKPLCLDEAEIEPLIAEARRARRLLAVGFNRRYSDLARRAREVMRRLRGPSLLVYRVNAGPLPATHWTQDPDQGGGRILGECCHFVDLLLFLLEEEVEAIDARALRSDGGSVVAGDSFAATLQFSGGSRAALVYTGLGDAGLPKERLEVFKGGAALVLDDFRSLTVHGGPGGSLHLKEQDKGVAAQWAAIARALRGDASEVIALRAIASTMHATFRLDRAVRGER